MALPLLICAQADRGSISGQVEDQQSAVVPNAHLKLTNQATGITLESTSDSAGDFSFLNLVPGSFKLTCESTGFRQFVQSPISVEVGRTVSVTVKLETGELQQTVMVSGDAGTIDTQTSDIGTAVTQQQIKDLPVPLTGDSRNPLSFVVLTPGVTGSEPGATPDYRIRVSGSNSYSSEVFIDGIPIANTNLSGDIATNHPSIDSINEFKITNNNQSAQYGLSSGVISFSFRSGTNQFHGSLFEYLQNDALNASDFVTNALGQVKAPLKQNEFGFTLGGPVWLPKLYNGRNKTFFFSNYTVFEYRPSSNNANVSTIPNGYRTGNFSQALGGPLTVPDPNGSGQQLTVYDAAGRPINAGQIYDPLSAH